MLTRRSAPLIPFWHWQETQWLRYWRWRANRDGLRYDPIVDDVVDEELLWHVEAIGGPLWALLSWSHVLRTLHLQLIARARNRHEDNELMAGLGAEPMWPYQRQWQSHEQRRREYDERPWRRPRGRL